MAAESAERKRPGGGEPSVADLLWDEPYRFEFFQALRVLSRLFPDRNPVGFDAPPKTEIARFQAWPSLRFPASEIDDVKDRSEESLPALMTVTFLGLYGPVGALPQPYTEMILERLRHKDRTLREFLDLFNHRLTSLFYRAWEKYRFYIPAERAAHIERLLAETSPAQHRAFLVERRPVQDLFSQIMLDVAGMGTPSLRFRSDVRDRPVGRLSTVDDTVRYFAGLLAMQHRSAVGLEGILEGYFDCTVRIDQFVGQWLPLDAFDQSRMAPGGNMELGESFVAGEKVWDVQSKMRVCLGPLSYREFCRFMPVGDCYRPLVDLVRMYSGPERDFEIELRLRSDEIPACQLGATEGAGSRLGWNTWNAAATPAGPVAKVRLIVNDG